MIYQTINVPSLTQSMSVPVERWHVKIPRLFIRPAEICPLLFALREQIRAHSTDPKRQNEKKASYRSRESLQ